MSRLCRDVKIRPSLCCLLSGTICLSTLTKTNDWLAQQVICWCRDVLLISHLVTCTWLALFPAVAGPSALCGGDFLPQSVNHLKDAPKPLVAGLIRAQGRERSTFSLFSSQISNLLNNFAGIWREKGEMCVARQQRLTVGTYLKFC